MPWAPPTAVPKCPACKISVYPAEAFMASDRRPFHKQCVKCFNCRKALNSSTINNHQETVTIFLKSIYAKKFWCLPTTQFWSTDDLTPPPEKNLLIFKKLAPLLISTLFKI